MSSSSTRRGRHRSSTVSNSYAGHATPSPLPPHLTDEYFTRVLHGGKSRRMSMSEASQSSRNSSSSSETIKAPVTELSFPASSSLPDKPSLPRLPVVQAPDPFLYKKPTEPVSTPSLLPPSSSDFRRYSHAISECEQFLEEYFNSSQGGGQTSVTEEGRPSSVGFIHSDPSIIPNLSSVIKMSKHIKQLDSDLKNRYELKNYPDYTTARELFDFKTSIYESCADVDTTGKAVFATLQMTYDDCWNKYKAIRTKQPENRPGMLNKIGASIQALQHQSSDATLVQPTIVPSVKDALVNVTDLRDMQPTFNMSAATLNILTGPSTKTLVSDFKRSSSPVSVRSYASTESFSLLDAPSDLGRHSPAPLDAIPKELSLRARSRVTVNSRSSTTPFIAESRDLGHRSTSRSSVRSASSISSVKTGSSRTRFRILEPETPIVSRSHSVPDFARSPLRSSSYSQKPLPKVDSVSTSRSPSPLSEGSIRSSERRLAMMDSDSSSRSLSRCSEGSIRSSERRPTRMKREDSVSSCSSIPSTYNLSWGGSSSDSDSDVYVPPAPRRAPNRDTIGSFTVELDATPDDPFNDPSLAKKLYKMGLLTQDCPTAIPAPGTYYAGSLVGHDLVIEGGKVFAATVPALIRFVTEPGELLREAKVDALDTWFVFFRSITVPEVFFGLLEARFNETMPPNLSEDRREHWEEAHTVIKSGVLDILSSWVKDHWLIKDQIVEPKVCAFIEDIMQTDLDPISRSLVNSIKERVGTRSTKQYPYHLEEPIRRGEQKRPIYTDLGSLRSIAGRVTTKIRIDHFLGVAGAAEQIARSLTAIESQYFHSFPLHEIVCFRETDYSTALLAWERFDASFFCWVSDLLANKHHTKAQTVKIYELLIDVAKECQKLRNYNSAYMLLVILRSNFVPVSIRELATDGHKKAVHKLHKFYRPPLFIKYSAKLVKKCRPAIPILALVKKDIRKAEEIYSKYLGVLAIDRQTWNQECMFEVGRYSYYCKIFRVLEMCYAEHNVPDDQSITQWIRMSCDKSERKYPRSSVPAPI